jgi:hypothetical protein
MKKILSFLFAFILSASSIDAQVKISSMPTYSGAQADVYVPIVKNGVNYKAPASFFGGVTSVHGRTGVVVGLEADYSGFYPVLSGSYVNPSWISSLAWNKITGTPTTLAGYGITDPIVLTSGSYSDPSWITALDWDKIIDKPTTLAGFGITDPVVVTTTTYNNPAWLNQLAWSKITGTPTTLAGYGISDAASSSHVHSGADITSGTVNYARLGTGGTGAGTKYLADDNTFKTISAGGIPAGNFGNVQINRHGSFATPASDSLSYTTADGLRVKNIGLFDSTLIADDQETGLLVRIYTYGNGSGGYLRIIGNGSNRTLYQNLMGGFHEFNEAVHAPSFAVGGGVITMQNNGTFAGSSGGLTFNPDNNYSSIFNTSNANTLGVKIVGKAGQVSDLMQWQNNVGTALAKVTANGSLHTPELYVTTSKTPSSATDTGTTGQIAWDANYIYICVSTDTWRRVAHSTW